MQIILPNELIDKIVKKYFSLFYIYEKYIVNNILKLSRNFLLFSSYLNYLYKTTKIAESDFNRLNSINKYKIRHLCLYVYYIDENCPNFLTKNYKYISKLYVDKSIHLYRPNKELLKLFKNLKDIPNLNVLDLYGCDISVEEIIELSQNLKYIPKLTNLNISCTGISNKGIIELSQNFNYISNLTKLNLSYNYIDNKGLIILSNCLIYIPNLYDLNLSNNFISDKGIIELSNYLEYIPKLSKLYLCSNYDISYEAINYLLSKQKNLYKLVTFQHKLNLRDRYPHIIII